MQELIREVNQITQNELNRANEKFPLFHSPHEAYSIVLEELEESEYEMERAKKTLKTLWEEIKLNESADILTLTALDLNTKATLLACESTQLAAMCTKFIDSFTISPVDTENKNVATHGQALNEK